MHLWDRGNRWEWICPCTLLFLCRLVSLPSFTLRPILALKMWSWRIPCLSKPLAPFQVLFLMLGILCLLPNSLPISPLLLAQALLWLCSLTPGFPYLRSKFPTIALTNLPRLDPCLPALLWYLLTSPCPNQSCCLGTWTWPAWLTLSTSSF